MPANTKPLSCLTWKAALWYTSEPSLPGQAGRGHHERPILSPALSTVEGLSKGLPRLERGWSLLSSFGPRPPPPGQRSPLNLDVNRQWLSSGVGIGLFLPVLSCPFEYLFYRLSFVKPPRDFHIVSRFTVKQSDERRPCMIIIPRLSHAVNTL
jgi:hypothetical protein